MGAIMKVAFVGKGGSGKTTLAALFARYLAAAGAPVVAIDADINQHLGVALGLDEAAAAALPSLGGWIGGLKEYLRGDNPRIPSAAAMTKTTPPGTGSRVLRVAGDDPVHRSLARDAGGVQLLVTGVFEDTDLGVSCYHSKTGAAELYLNHLADEPGEYVVTDMTAGADSFASGLFTRFDVTFLVAEPTRRGVSVFRQYAGHAAGYDVTLFVIGNKVRSQADVDYLRAEAGDHLAGWASESDFVRSAERGEFLPLAALEPGNLALLGTLREIVDAQVKDWDRYQRQAIEMHLKNARGNAGLIAQVDESFRLDDGVKMGAWRTG
jgi:CO dehydrogenase maturation factor